MQKQKNETAPQYVVTAMLPSVSKQQLQLLLADIHVAQTDFTKRPTAIQAEYVTYKMWYWLQEFNLNSSSIISLMAFEFEQKVTAKVPNWQMYFYYQKVLEGLQQLVGEIATQEIMP